MRCDSRTAVRRDRVAGRGRQGVVVDDVVVGVIG